MNLAETIKAGIAQRLLGTSAVLGDRTAYVGSSDVAGCLRKALMGKTMPVEHGDETLVHFLRGHIAEEVVAQALAARGMTFTRQFDAYHPEKPYLRAHVDFLFGALERKRVSVMEVKSSTQIPDAPYESWVRQLSWQMALLDAMAPGAEIHGTVLCVDIVGARIHAYPVVDSRDMGVFMESMLERGERLYRAMKGEIMPEEVKPEPGALCGFCAHRQDCPAMQVDGDGIMSLAPIHGIIEEYAQIKEQINIAQKQQENLREEILRFMGEAAIGRANGFRVERQIVSSRRFDTNRFKRSYPDLYDQFAVATESVRLIVSDES